jgi:hypothetical protein
MPPQFLAENGKLIRLQTSVSLLAHLRLEDRVQFDKIFGKAHEGDCDLYLRLDRRCGDFSEKWDHFLIFQRQRLTSAQVVMRTTFSRVRLYHLLDLLRLLIDNQTTRNLGDDAFALTALAALNPFASSREVGEGPLPSLPASAAHPDSGIPGVFYNRWCLNPPSSTPDLHQLVASPPTPMPEPLTLELLPKVMSVHWP